MSKGIFWFRRDLRIEDNAGLYRALKNNDQVVAVFIFDTNILDKLENKKDARVSFIYETIQGLKLRFQKNGSDLLVRYGDPKEVWKKLIEEEKPDSIYTNHDYEPYAKERDQHISELAKNLNVSFHTFKDQVIFEKDEVVKDDGTPYIVYTPYSKAWKQKANEFYFKSYPSEDYLAGLEKRPKETLVPLESMGFEKSDIEIPQKEVSQSLIKNYHDTRDFPAIEGTSKLSIHFRFGTISIREKIRKARNLNEKFYNELIWRDFYQMILWHFPKVVNESFKKEYDDIEWLNNEEDFEAWKQGNTGYPIVDAGMRELNTSGYMHNRVRMIVASFLCKHLLIDWRWGEAYFAEKLLDFDLASNNGGWQWAAGSGVDAAPYFRIFNPWLQEQKFDKDQKYIKNWVPEFDTSEYPEPIVEHSFARDRCLLAYKVALAQRK